jgi:cytochrome c5
MKASILMRRAAAVGLLLLGPVLTAEIDHRASPDDKTQDGKAQTAAPRPPVPPTGGDGVFQQNCSRCHMPPMTISPRITGTVIMHMRVRARLSREDERLLMKYLAP